MNVFDIFECSNEIWMFDDVFMDIELFYDDIFIVWYVL